jgi:hypothetical protein
VFHGFRLAPHRFLRTIREALRREQPKAD